MLKLNCSFFLLLGTLTSQAILATEEPAFIQPIADYHHIGDPEPIDAKPSDLPLIDLNEMQQDFILETKKIEIEGHPFAFNPSIVRWNGSLLLSFRTYHLETRSTNPFGLVWLDEDFNPISTPQIFELPFHNPVLASKQQDPRLITVGSRLFVVYNNILEDVIHREMRRIFISELNYDGSTFTASNPECLKHFESENGMCYEKNWVPFDFNDQLHLSYSIIPHKVLRPISGTNTCETVCNTMTPFKWGWGVPRGGTQAIKDGDQYLGFFHSWENRSTVQSSGKKICHYVMGAYTFNSEPPFNITAASTLPIISKVFYEPPFYKTWKPMRCIFPAGLILDENFAWVTYGRQDHEMWVVKIDKKKLLTSLVPTSAE